MSSKDDLLAGAYSVDDPANYGFLAHRHLLNTLRAVDRNLE